MRQEAAPPRRRRTASLLRASALDRLALAVAVAGLLWIGVLWAVR